MRKFASFFSTVIFERTSLENVFWLFVAHECYATIFDVKMKSSSNATIRRPLNIFFTQAPPILRILAT